jgi:TfoX/Sxy family transcriptional regulator of competence genes
MPSLADSSTPYPATRAGLVRDVLAALGAVRVRKLFGSEAFFTGERMFAVLGRDALILRLPEPLRTNALLAGGARAFLSDRLGPSHGWIELPYDSELAQLGELARAAHAAALRGRKPARRRFRRAAKRPL